LSQRIDCDEKIYYAIILVLKFQHNNLLSNIRDKKVGNSYIISKNRRGSNIPFGPSRGQDPFLDESMGRPRISTYL
jgi:hypothetical protein